MADPQKPIRKRATASTSAAATPKPRAAKPSPTRSTTATTSATTSPATGPTDVTEDASPSHRRPPAARAGVAVMALPSHEPKASAPVPTEGPIVERLTVDRASVGHAQAVQADVRQGSIGRLHAVDVAVHQGAIGFARGDKVSVEYGAVGLSVAGETRISQAGVRTVIARDVTFEQGIIGTSVSATARFERSSAVLLLVAQKVEGNVKVLFDWRAGLAFGAVVGLLVALLRRR